MWRFKRSRILSCLAVFAALTWIAATGPAVSALTIPVTAADGTPMGTIDVNVSADGSGVVGGFTSTYPSPPPPDAKPSLAAAAAYMGEDHFNWFQVVLADNDPPTDAAGNPLTPPYIDPPPGGYPGQWGDDLPWYWDEGTPPKPGDPGFQDYDPAYDRTSQEVDTNNDAVIDKLNFADFPNGPVPTNLEFVTFLVSLNADGSLHSLHGGFTWTWSNDPTGGGGDDGEDRRNLFPPYAPLAFLDETQPGLTPAAGLALYSSLVPEPSGVAWPCAPDCA